MSWLSGGHVPERLLVEIADGMATIADLPARQRDHVATCGQCKALKDGHRRAADLLQRGATGRELPVPSRSSGPGTWLVAGSAAIGVAFVAFVSFAPRAPHDIAVGSSADAKITPAPSRLTPRPSNLSTETWTIVGSGSSMWSRWSATGNFLIVGTTPAADSGSQPSIDLFDRAGKKLRAVDGDRAAWLLDDALLVTSRDSGRIESLDGTAVALPGSFGKDVLPGRDVVAVPVAGPRFEVRGSDGVLATGDGVPVAWSPDGARLAVFRPSRTGSGTSASVAGVLEVRTWPGLAKVGPDVAASRVTPAFDASGAHLAFADPTESRIGIFDLASGKVTANVDGLPSFAWTGATLDVVSGDGSVLTVETTGRSSPSGMTGDTIVGTTVANDLLVFTANEASPIALVTEAGPRLVEAPGRVGLKSTIGGNGLVALVLVTETGEELRLSRD